MSGTKYPVANDLFLHPFSPMSMPLAGGAQRTKASTDLLQQEPCARTHPNCDTQRHIRNEMPGYQMNLSIQTKC